MITFIFLAVGLLMLMTAGHIEYKTRSNDEIRPTQNEVLLRSVSNLALLSWLGFGFSAAFWTSWYWALPALIVSAILPGFFSSLIIERNLVEKVIYMGASIGFISCLLAVIVN